LTCRPEVLAAAIAHARDASPAECCGILLGRDNEIVEAVRVRNLADSPTRYLLDPAGHLAAQRDGRARGVDVLGFYHSHPHSPAVPSETDIAEAAYPGYLYLIVSLEQGRPEARLFRWDGSRFDAVVLTA
jgi:proteasome lid subunit RPN8/RPN11